MWTAKTDQTGWMPRLIWVFAGHINPFVGFVVQQLIYGKQANGYDAICDNIMISFSNIFKEIETVIW